MRKKRFCNFIIVGLLIFSVLHPISVEAGEDSTRDSIGADIDQYIEECKEGTASISVAVFNGQETLYSTQYGYSNVEDQVEVDEDTVYEWGSVTKLLVWVSVMQLYEKGQINLEEDIQNYLPEIFLTKLQYDEPITMLHLMNHTAGFQETTYPVETDNPQDIESLEETLKQSEPTQIYAAGEVCSYSNWGVSLAAYMVECISGQTFDEYVKENIFVPLGMEHTAILPDWSDNTWVQEQRQELYCYSIYEDSFESYGQSIFYVLLYPSGAATGTLDDFLTFAKSLVPEEGELSPLFEKEATLDLLLSPTSYYGDTGLVRNCHGLWTMPYGDGILGHSGNTSGCSTCLYFDPDFKTGAVVMTNEMGETAYCYGLLSIIFGDYDLDSNITASDTDISGIYTSARATFESGVLKLSQYIGSILPLKQTDDPQVYDVLLTQDTVTQIDDDIFLCDNGNGLVKVLVRVRDNDGTTRLETMSQDIFKENTVTYVAKVLFLLLYVAAVACAFIMLIVNLINLLYRLLRKKKVNFGKPDIFRLCTYLTVVLSGVLVNSIIDVENYIITAIKCILLCIITTVPFIYVIILKRTKSHRIILVMGVLLLSNVIYWQWFNFWSY